MSTYIINGNWQTDYNISFSNQYHDVQRVFTECDNLHISVPNEYSIATEVCANPVGMDVSELHTVLQRLRVACRVL